MFAVVAAAATPAEAQPGVTRGSAAGEVRSPSEFAPIELNEGPGDRRAPPDAPPRYRSSDPAGADSALREKTPIRRATAETAAGRNANLGRINSPWTTLITLAAVLIGAALAARLLRRVAGGQASDLPDSALEVLGSRKLDAQSSVHLVRVGRRVLAVGSSPAGVRPLTEIDDPLEVAALLAGEGLQSARPAGESTKLFGGTPLVRRSSLAVSPAVAAREETAAVRRPAESVRGLRDA